MIQSMTGYGRASSEQADISCLIEIRSVNNRFLKTTLHLPDDMADGEVEIERRLREKVSRGSVVVNVSLALTESTTGIPIHAATAQGYLRELLDMAEAEKSHPQAPRMIINLADILALPGVCVSPQPTHETAQRNQSLVLRLFDEALTQMLQMREREGAALWKDLQFHLAEIRAALEQIRTQAPAVARQYHERLRNRVLQLVGEAKLSLSDSDLLREVALFSERADISEEISRLGGHLDHFIHQADQENQVGRTLDFIAQEMLREANTIGSKCSDGQIARLTLQIKGTIDRIKEQIQNVE